MGEASKDLTRGLHAHVNADLQQDPAQRDQADPVLHNPAQGRRNDDRLLRARKLFVGLFEVLALFVSHFGFPFHPGTSP